MEKERTYNYVYQPLGSLDFPGDNDPPIYGVGGPDVTGINKAMLTGIKKAAAELHAKRLNEIYGRKEIAEMLP